MDLREIVYEKYNQRAKITINRPHKLNALTPRTLAEMLWALEDAWADDDVGAVILTGAGDRAFCVGGDQSIREKGGYTYDDVGDGPLARMPLPTLHSLLLQTIRNIPKPVVAMVNGYAIGGGHVLHVVCDLTVASETARFGQVGPRVGSFDAGYGSAYLARVVGEKKAREIWFLCEQYSAQEALEMGLVNWVVPPERLVEKTEAVCDALIAKSPTALAALKASFNADSDSVWGIHQVAGVALNLYYGTDEALEGRNAFLEKRAPNFRAARRSRTQEQKSGGNDDV
jgi:dihydroxynaphthoic acid synthetase